ncbi:MAG TPA: hypothetical protein VNM68_05475 [Candidatus Polarisedimenticolia bacterium]|nr:hypothetical protein [Candidatus Polarisedimenticolia bacterium]
MSWMKHRLLACAIAAGSAVLFATPAFSSPRPGPASIFTPDKGKFRILVNGQEVGKEDFEISRSGDKWIARGTTDIKSEGSEMRVSGTLELNADGTPARYEWSMQGAKKASSSISFSGPTATIELRLAGAKPYTQQFTFKSPQIAVLDNNLYDHYAVLARLYDWNNKGTQTFSVLVPQELTPGTVTVESLGSQQIDGKKLEELRVNTEDLEVDLYLDGQRLVRIVAPSNNAEIVRE